MDAFEEALKLGSNAPADPVGAAVDGFRQTGVVTNKQAADILMDSKAVAALQAQGLDLKNADSASARRKAVKDAVARLAQANTNELNIDNTGSVGYNNNINGGEQNDRAGGYGANQAGVPGVYEGRRANDSGWRESSGASVGSGLVLLSPASQDILTQRGVVNVELYESSGDNAAFSAALDNARAADTVHGWAVTPKTSEELDGGNIRTFMDGNGSTGFAIAPDGDIEAVFANKAAGAPKGSTKVTIPLAIANGGTKLDCYGEGLVRLYSKYGFVPVARCTFNPKYANDGWTPAKGTPDIYFMMHNGDSADTVVQNYGNYHIPTKAELDALPVMEYDDAYAYRDKLLAERDSRNQDSTQATAEAKPGTLEWVHELVELGSGKEAQKNTVSGETAADIDGVATKRTAYRTPTYEELVSKPDIPIVLVGTNDTGKSYADLKTDVMRTANENKWFEEPHINTDTGMPVFVTQASFTHAFSNLRSDFGTDTILAMGHIPELIQTSVLTHVDPPKDPRKAETKVYTFLGAIAGKNGVEPVKLTVKEYNSRNAAEMPQNILNFFRKNKTSSTYNRLYDAKALEVLSVESAKKELGASASVAGGKLQPGAKGTPNSTIKIADLLGLVKGEAQKYMPKKSEAVSDETHAQENEPTESVGAAPEGFTGKQGYYDQLTDENSQPDRPGDVRPMEVLKEDKYGRKVTEFAANAYGAEVTSDRMADRIQNQHKGRFYVFFTPHTEPSPVFHRTRTVPRVSQNRPLCFMCFIDLFFNCLKRQTKQTELMGE